MSEDFLKRGKAGLKFNSLNSFFSQGHPQLNVIQKIIFLSRGSDFIFIILIGLENRFWAIWLGQWLSWQPRCEAIGSPHYRSFLPSFLPPPYTSISLLFSAPLYNGRGNNFFSPRILIWQSWVGKPSGNPEREGDKENHVFLSLFLSLSLSLFYNMDLYLAEDRGVIKLGFKIQVKKNHPDPICKSWIGKILIKPISN